MYHGLPEFLSQLFDLCLQRSIMSDNGSVADGVDDLLVAQIEMLNGMFSQFMPVSTENFQQGASISGLMGNATRDDKGRFVTSDGVRFNIRFWRFANDVFGPDDPDYYMDEEPIPDDVRWNPNTRKFVRN